MATPTFQNMFPSSARSVEKTAKFHRSLKTFFDNVAYPP